MVKGRVDSNSYYAHEAAVMLQLDVDIFQGELGSRSKLQSITKQAIQVVLDFTIYKNE
jgi:hypothetical protein